MKIPFGFLDSTLSITSNNFHIAPFGHINPEDVKKLADDDGWITAPSIKDRIFSLPFNYQLNGDFDSPEHGKFIIWCLSFLLGVKLSTLPREFLDATNIKPYSSFGFMIIKHSDIECALNICYQEFLSNCLQNNIRILSIIHLLFMSRIKYYLAFEKFNYSYIAIDCCYRFIKTKYGITSKLHRDRMNKLAQWAGFNLPTCFHDLYNARNYIFHEGLYENVPLGYSHPKYDLLFLNNFICKILFKILNINAPEYISEVPCETRDMIGITLTH